AWPSELPKIPSQVNIDPWTKHPCDVLSEQQMNSLSITSTPNSSQTSSGPKCNWGDLYKDGIIVSGTFGVNITSTIPGLYKNDRLGKYAYFDPTVIKNYPAVYYGLSEDRDGGSCA